MLYDIAISITCLLAVVKENLGSFKLQPNMCIIHNMLVYEGRLFSLDLAVQENIKFNADLKLELEMF